MPRDPSRNPPDLSVGRIKKTGAKIKHHLALNPLGCKNTSYELNARAAPEPTEAQVLASVLAYLQRHPQVVWVARMNSGAGMMVRGGKVGQFMRFGFPGCPDIMGMLKGGKALYVECKRPSGKLTPEQREFLQRAADHGGCAFVARSIEDCIAHLISPADTN